MDKKFKPKQLKNFIVSRQNLDNENYTEVIRLETLFKAKMFIYSNKGIYKKFRIYDNNQKLYVKIYEY